MANNMVRWYQVMALLTVGSAITAVAGSEIPSKTDRDKADSELRTKEQDLKHRSTAIDDSVKLRANLAKSIEALEKTYTPLAKEADDMTAQAKKRITEAKASGNADAIKSAEQFKEQADAMQIELQKMQVALESLQKLKKQADEQHDMDQKAVNRLKLDLQKALQTYFRTADPAMIAQRYGVPLDINFSFNATEFMKVTNGGDPQNWLSRYGLVAEHTWDERFTYMGKDGRKTITLKGISQHEQVTTRDMYEMATKLIQAKVPGMKAPVGRFGLTRNWGHFKNDHDPYQGVFGHPVDAFRPSVLSNSTGAWSPLNEWDAFRELIDHHTKGEGATTYNAPNGTITYGLPPMGRPILVNASGNSGYGFVPDTTNIQNFFPNHVNIGTVTIPVDARTGKRDEKAVREVESYSTSNAGVHGVIMRPRYEKDGTEITFQYLNPNFERTLEENLWKLAGKAGIPTPEQLADEKEYPPELVKAIAEDKAAFIQVILRNEGVDAKGQTKNLRGTSFACPTAAGVLMAARLYYPNASEAEITDAFCSSCVPIMNRRDVDAFGRDADLKDDIPYIVDMKKGYAYSPTVGFGEFVMDPVNPTPENSPSWFKMLGRLEAMQKAREKMSNAPVTVGHGPDKRTVNLNGQPSLVSLEMNKFTEIVTEEDKKRVSTLEKNITEAFENVDKLHGGQVMKDGEISKQIKSGQYRKALELLKEKTSKAILPIDLLPPPGLGGALALPLGEMAKTDTMSKAEAAVAQAEKMKQRTYQFTVLEGQDLCTTMSALRLKFKDMNKTDSFVILESPDGTRIPIIMGSSQDWRGMPTGVAVASTPGFMRKSAAGDWKLYTREELDPNGTELFLYGTERNAKLGILDVRETVLNELERAEAKQRTNVPAKNLLAIADPHKHLRTMNGLEGTPSAKREKATEITPSSRQKFQEYFEELINKSRTIETLKEKGIEAPATNGHIEKVSLNETGQTDRALGVAIASMASQLSSLLADASRPSALDTPLRDAWGYLASAVASAGGEIPDHAQGKKIPERVGYLSLLKKHKDEVPPWWHDNQVAQVEASRRAMRVGGRKA
jgi:hypothetical protein